VEERPQENAIESRIFMLRGQRVMLDTDLAGLYGVAVKALNQAVKRNMERFPADFMFQLSVQETESLRSQFVTLKQRGASASQRGRHSKYRSHAFTEQGVAMLSSVLKSKTAISVNIEIMRVFVRVRDLTSHNRELARRIHMLESKYDKQFKVVFDAIRALMAPERTTRVTSSS
jgi:ORF6N domain